MCQNCHNWSDVSQTPPQLVDVLGPANSGSALYGEAATLKAGVKALSQTSRTIVIRFNQYVLRRTDTNSAENIANYTLTENGLPFSLTGATTTVQPDGKSVVLRLGADLNSVNSYQLQVQNIKDTNYITMSLTTVPVTFN